MNLTGLWNAFKKVFSKLWNNLGLILFSLKLKQFHNNNSPSFKGKREEL